MKKSKKIIIWTLILFVVLSSSAVALLIFNINQEKENSVDAMQNGDVVTRDLNNEIENNGEITENINNETNNNIDSMQSDENMINIDEFTVIIDPGHGKEENGATCNYDGVYVSEKDLNLKIAYMLKKELKSYKTQTGNSVKIVLTRENDEYNPKLKDRVILGVENNADLVISLHNNASSDNSRQFCGAMILVTSSHYYPEKSRFGDLFEVEYVLGKSILQELKKIGLQNSNDPISSKNTKNEEGILRRISSKGKKYLNGDCIDWYGIIRKGVKLGIPTILVEHAYLDNENDFCEFLSTDEKLKKLAIADAKGIANYYNLIKTNNT